MNEISLISNENGVYASTRDVAKNFNKKHAEVLYAIEGRIDKDGKPKNNGILMSGISQLSKMFIKTEYVDSMGRIKNEYLMDRDGFSLLCMGFTGNEALEWKLKYIEAFNKMEGTILELNRKANLLLEIYGGGQSGIIAAKQLTELEVKEATAPLIAENKELKPKAEFHDAIQVSKTSVSFGDFSGTLQNNKELRSAKLGRNTVMEWCRDQGYLCSSYDLKNKPSQQMISSGYMEYKENTNERNGRVYITYKPLLTGKGQIWLTKKLVEFYGEAA